MNRKKDGLPKWKPTVYDMEVDVFGYKTAKKKKDKKEETEKKPEPLKENVPV